MGKWLKKLGKILGVIVGVLVLLVLLVLLFLQTGPGENFVKKRVLSALEAELVGDVEIDRIEGGIVGGIEIYGLVIHDARGNVAARAPHASADYDLLQLLKSELHLDSVVLDRPLVIGRRYEDGTISLSTLTVDKPEPKKAPSQFQVTLKDARVNGGLLVWIDHPQLEDVPKGGVEAWLEAVEDSKTTTEQLTERIRTVLAEPPPGKRPGTAIAVAALGGLDLQASFYSYGSGELSGNLERLSATAWTNATDEPQDFLVENLSFLRTAPHLEATLAGIRLGSLASVRQLTVGVEFLTRTDELGNRAVVGIDEFIAEVDEAQVLADMVHLFAPEAPITGKVSASASVGGTLDDFAYLLRVGCGDAPSTTVAGTAAFPGQGFAGAKYDLAARFEKLRPSRCFEIGKTTPDLSGALLVRGEGTNPKTLEATARLALDDSRIDDYRIDSAYVDASAKDGRFRIERFDALTPYAKASLDGRFGLDGDYRVRLAIDANEEIRELADKLGRQKLTSDFAQVRLSSEGTLDLDAKSPLGHVEQGSLSLDWRLRDFALEKYRLGSSRGDVSVRVSPASDAPAAGQRDEAPPGARFIEFAVDVEGERIDTPQLSAQRLAVEAKGQGILEVPVDDFLKALRRLSSTWHVEIRRLQAQQTRIRRADIRAKIDRSGPGRPFEWDAEGTIGGARMGKNRVGEANFDLDGTAQVNQTDRGVELGPISAQGTANISDLEAGETRVGKGRVEVDVRGDVPDLQGTVNVDATDVEAAGESFESVEAEVNVQKDRQFEVTARADRGDGKATITLDAAGKAGKDLREFEFRRFELEAPDMEMTLPEGARVEITEDGVTFDKMRLQMGDQYISVEGTYRTKGRQDLRVELADVKIGEIRERFDLQEVIPPVDATVSGDVSLQGTAERPIIAIELHLRDIYYRGYGPFGVDLIATYESRRLSIETFEASAYETRVLVASGQMPLDLNLSGDIDVPRTSKIDMDVRIPRLALQEFYEPVPVLEELSVAGVIFANLHVAGTVRNPRLKLEFEGQNLAFAGEVGNEYLEIEQVSTALKADYSPPSGGRGGISGRYDLSWRGDPIVEARLSTPMPLAEWIRRMLDEDLAAPDYIDAIAKLPFDLSLELANLDLGQVPLESFAQAEAAGTVSLNLSGDGTFSNPRLDFELALDGFGWNAYRDIFVAADLRLRNQMVHIDELRTKWNADEVISASGKFPLPTDAILNGEPLADLPIDLTLELSRYPISRLSVIDYTYASYKGELAAYAKITGTLSDPKVEGRAGLFNTELLEGQNGTVALSFKGEDGEVYVDASVCRAYGEVMMATARLPVTTNIIALTQGAALLEEGEIFAEISSERMPLAQLVPTKLIGDYVSEPEGMIEIDARIEGTWEEPRVSGRLLVEDGAVTIPYYGRRFTDIQIDVEANQDKVELARFQVAEGESWVRADGTIDMVGFRPTTLDATIRSKEFNFGGFAEGFAAFVDSTIELDGDLSGDVRRIRAHATSLEVTVPEGEGGDLHPTSMDSEIVVLQRRTDGNEALDIDNLFAQPESEEKQQTPTHIQFIADRGSWVRHPVADVEFTADFTTMLEGSRISMLGSVDTVRGNASLLGKEFEVPEHENAVRFTGASPPNPALDIEALHYLDRALTDEIGEPAEGQPRIIVRVRGRAKEPSLVLESDPVLTETEIIYVLMTGRAPNQAGVGDESRISGLALGAASGLFAGLLQQRLAGTLPLDVVRLRPGEEGFSDARVEVGKYITKDIFVSYTLRLGAEEGEGINVISVDYRFAQSWSLEFQTSDALTGGVNIFWDVY